MSCQAGCAHHHDHGSCHSSCHVSSHPTYGWTGQQSLVLNWVMGDRLSEDDRPSTANINGLRDAIRELNNHDHSNVSLTDNVSTSPDGFTDDPVSTIIKCKAEHLDQIKTWIEIRERDD